MGEVQVFHYGFMNVRATEINGEPCRVTLEKA